MTNPITDGLERLRTRWPQSHAVAGAHGDHLIFVPSVLLPYGWSDNICTVLFIAPPGFPAARPSGFFTDIDIRLKSGALPYMTRPVLSGNRELDSWPQWAGSKKWFWKLQMWDPHRSGLYTYMKVIQMRFNRAE